MSTCIDVSAYGCRLGHVARQCHAFVTTGATIYSKIRKVGLPGQEMSAE
jgi:hypothetical protein